MFSFLTKKDPETEFIKKADRELAKEMDFIKPMLMMVLLRQAQINNFNRAIVSIIEKHTCWRNDPIMGSFRENALLLQQDEQKTSSIQTIAYQVSEKEIETTIPIPITNTNTNTDTDTDTDTDNLITNDNISDKQKISSIQTVDRFIENLILVEYWFYIIRKDDLAVTAHKNVIKRAIKRLIEQKEIPTAIYSDLINRSRFYELIVISQAMISLGYPSPIEKLTWTKLNYSEFTLIENITENDVNKYLQGLVRRHTLLEDFKIPHLDLDMLDW